ncbi:hypothetical protein L6452_00793 [Arctium lappa]|uniref:Uncharacterized protein n=1 Tax=Arctium lappa TaxID=4217 RepID=A0ACB9FFV6_ARCLA|nr:hypothetical protein L6452_00793 [Arctium lappa]
MNSSLMVIFYQKSDENSLESESLPSDIVTDLIPTDGNDYDDMLIEDVIFDNDDDGDVELEVDVDGAVVQM